MRSSLSPKTGVRVLSPSMRMPSSAPRTVAPSRDHPRNLWWASPSVTTAGSTWAVTLYACCEEATTSPSGPRYDSVRNSVGSQTLTAVWAVNVSILSPAA